MRLAAAHGLRELEDRLLGFPLKSPESLKEQRAHPIGDMVLFEERRSINSACCELGQAQDGIAFGDIKDALARRAELFESLHRGSSTFMRRKPRS
jgi:hypothetical protein